MEFIVAATLTAIAAAFKPASAAAWRTAVSIYALRDSKPFERPAIIRELARLLGVEVCSQRASGSTLGISRAEKIKGRLRQMSNVVQQRNCPSWCARHHDPDEPDGGHFHFAEDETIRVADRANPTRVGLARSDSPAGEQLTTIVMDVGDGGHEMTVSEAAQLASLLLAQVARAIGN